MWSAGLKVRNFQNRTEPIRLFNISNFPSIVKDELAVLQQRDAAQIPAETRITYDTLLANVVFYFFIKSVEIQFPIGSLPKYFFNIRNRNKNVFLVKTVSIRIQINSFIFRLFYNSCIYYIRNQTSKYLEKFNWNI